MAEQLTIAGLWERSPEGASEPPLRPVDPRHADLLSGAQLFRSRLEDACAALDGPAVRHAHRELTQRFLSQDWAANAPVWADFIDWLTTAPTADEQAVRALFDDARLPAAPAVIVRLVRSAAAKRAAERLIAERGPAAAMPDGRPAAVLPLLAGDTELGLSLLREAVAVRPDARWLTMLAQASSQAADVAVATAAWCRVCLIDPTAFDPSAAEGPLLALLDEADERELSPAWLPVLADLRGVVPLDDGALQLPDQPTPAQLAAAALRRYRAQKPMLGDAARLKAKRELSRLLPERLREVLRPL